MHPLRASMLFWFFFRPCRLYFNANERWDVRHCLKYILQRAFSAFSSLWYVRICGITHLWNNDHILLFFTIIVIYIRRIITIGVGISVVFLSACTFFLFVCFFWLNKLVPVSAAHLAAVESCQLNHGVEQTVWMKSARKKVGLFQSSSGAVCLWCESNQADRSVMEILRVETLRSHKREDVRSI